MRIARYNIIDRFTDVKLQDWGFQQGEIRNVAVSMKEILISIRMKAATIN
ncbi:MAG: hypothetical protein JW801_04045 [Bacteroidales bacterium]|nr:hypothetical protein [Bacteroidales bacterium]